jgi:hypothetical protein
MMENSSKYSNFVRLRRIMKAEFDLIDMSMIFYNVAQRIVENNLVKIKPVKRESNHQKLMEIIVKFVNHIQMNLKKIEKN